MSNALIVWSQLVCLGASQLKSFDSFLWAAEFFFLFLGVIMTYFPHIADVLAKREFFYSGGQSNLPIVMGGSKAERLSSEGFAIRYDYDGMPFIIDPVEGEYKRGIVYEEIRKVARRLDNPGCLFRVLLPIYERGELVCYKVYWVNPTTFSVSKSEEIHALDGPSCVC